VSITPGAAARFLTLIVLSLTASSLLGQLAVLFLPDFVGRDRFAATFNVDGMGARQLEICPLRHCGGNPRDDRDCCIHLCLAELPDPGRAEGRAELGVACTIRAQS
jgi:hypothetical protein